MSENNSEPRLANLMRKARWFRNRAAMKIRDTELALDPRTKRAIEIIDPIGLELLQYRNAREFTPPKVLQLSVGETDYVSIRRLEGPQIQGMSKRLDRNPGDIFRTTISYHLPIDLYQDGGVVALLMPAAYNCHREKKEVEIVEQLASYPEADMGWVWEAMMAHKPELFNPKDWGVKINELIVTTMIGGHVFKTEMLDSNYFDLSKHRPDRDGTVVLTERSYFQSETQFDAEMDFVGKNARAYVLVEGSSQSEKKPGTLSKLVPSLAPFRV